MNSGGHLGWRLVPFMVLKYGKKKSFSSWRVVSPEIWLVLRRPDITIITQRNERNELWFFRSPLPWAHQQKRKRTEEACMERGIGGSQQWIFLTNFVRNFIECAVSRLLEKMFHKVCVNERMNRCCRKFFNCEKAHVIHGKSAAENAEMSSLLWQSSNSFLFHCALRVTSVWKVGYNIKCLWRYSQEIM